MIQISQMVQEMLDFGFSEAAELPVDDLKFLDEVRDMCKANRCGVYAKNWACPPACGTVAECEARVRQYRQGILVQYVGKLEDSFDYEGMQAAAARFRDLFMAKAAELKQRFPGMLALGSGHCGICKSCGYPDEPCRFPDQMYTPPEGYGLMLSAVCKSCGIPYIHGANTVTYIGCFFFA